LNYSCVLSHFTLDAAASSTQLSGGGHEAGSDLLRRVR